MIYETDESRIKLAASDPSTMLGYTPPAGSVTLVEGDPADVVVEAEGLLVDRAPARWLVALLAGAVGVIVGLLVAVALIPDQPDRILVPVEQPSPSAHVEPGVRA